MSLQNGPIAASAGARPPEISVLIPTYNYASYLPEAIKSVLTQDFQDFELLILDDRSSDNTAEVVKPFCDRDPRIRFEVNPTNLGMVPNWNECLRRAGGQYIKFLFGDDRLCDRQALGKMIALLRNNPSAILAASARMVLDEKSNVTDLWRTLPDGCHPGRKIIAACLAEDGNIIGEPSAALFRRADAQRGFDPAYRQWVDMEMWFHLLERGDLVYTREPLCGFRRHSLQQTEVNSASGIGDREYPGILRAYLGSAWLSRQLLFNLCHNLRRSRPRGYWSRLPPGERAELERCLGRKLGCGWYSVYLCKYKLMRPFENLVDSTKKRWPWGKLAKPANLPVLPG